MFEKLKIFVSEYIAISDHEWSEIVPYFEPAKIQKNEFIIRQGQICQYLYFINNGLLRMFYLKGGVEITRFFSCENEFASALTSFLTRKPTIENIQALEDCYVLKLSYNNLQVLYRTHPAWESFFRQLFQEAYIILTQRIEGLITKTAEERYNDLMNERPELIQRVPQQYIATFLGITPVSLSRIRNKNSKQ
jgi:CRP-like cAMP-binding protein